MLAALPAYIHEAIVRRYIEGASHRGLRADDLDAWTRSTSRSASCGAPTTRGFSPETGECLAGLIPGAALSVIDGAGHLMHHDAPVALGDEIRAWLGAVRDRGA